MKKLFLILAMALISCTPRQDNTKKVWAWMSGKTTMTNGQWDYYFQKAADAGIDAILLECHGGYPEELKEPADTDPAPDFRDYAAIRIIENALPFAQKYGIELHAWIWAINQTEHSLRNAHPA